MKYLVTLIACAAALSSHAVLAADATPETPAPAHNTRHQKMKDCNAQAKAEGKKGAERKAFMKECLSNKK